MSSANKRRQTDMMKLMMNDHDVETINDSINEFYVLFKGPEDSLYKGGVWKVKVELPDDYPYKSPSIGFVNKIYHPNIDETTGAVCLDVINQSWSPMFDLVNVFEAFLPQLLMYPNPSDPFNDDAASLLSGDQATYEVRVKEYCERYAKPADVGIGEDAKESDGEQTGEEHESEDEEKASGSADT